MTTSNGSRVHLELGDVKDFSLFPGQARAILALCRHSDVILFCLLMGPQIVACEGINSTGSSFNITTLFSV